MTRKRTLSLAIHLAISTALVAPAAAQERTIQLSDVGGAERGFRIDGVDANDQTAISVSGAGDVNGDGIGDVIVGAWFADPGGASDAGESYVVFGKTDGTPVDLATIDGGGGFGSTAWMPEINRASGFPAALM
ncbi:MAG: integrin alpha [Xanthomonadales bacterium]|nr:integrin alpha [Xanthomonadales bacterium]